ncbi:MAG: HAMP domain-containing protein [Deltaproteobacteria bacterium]|nr:HAMP domain-containing protein [Deltaproteobacteria bacterium]
MKNRLERKILGITGFVIVISFIAAFTMNALVEINSLETEGIEKSRLIGETIQKSIYTIMLTGNGDIASQWSNDLRGINNLKELYVIRRDGMLAFRDMDTLNMVNQRLGEEHFHRDELKPIRIMDEDDKRLQKVLNEQKEMNYMDKGKEGNIFVQIKPIFNGIKCNRCHTKEHDVLGMLKISTTMGEIDRGVKSIITFSVVGGLLSVSVVIGFLWILIRIFVTKPIHHVAGAINDIIGSKDLVRVVAYKSRDEIGTLVHGFNIMLKRLNGLYTTLEEKVEERTRQLIQAEKIASVGQLATGLVHEIRNPLNSVKFALQIMEKESTANSAYKGDILAISGEIQRIENLLNNLLRFARPHPPQFSIIDINEVVDRALVLVRKKAENAGIQVITNLKHQLPKIKADPDLMQQIFLNIILNAIHAMPDGGSLTVATKDVHDNVEVSFSDTGHGIPSEYINKIFDPFFTTKGSSGGSGLGLSISYRIVEEHKGEIFVESKEGGGTSFTIKLDAVMEGER